MTESASDRDARRRDAARRAHVSRLGLARICASLAEIIQWQRVIPSATAYPSKTAIRFPAFHGNSQFPVKIPLPAPLDTLSTGLSHLAENTRLKAVADRQLFLVRDSFLLKTSMEKIINRKKQVFFPGPSTKMFP